MGWFNIVNMHSANLHGDIVGYVVIVIVDINCIQPTAYGCPESTKNNGMYDQ